MKSVSGKFTGQFIKKSLMVMVTVMVMLILFVIPVMASPGPAPTVPPDLWTWFADLVMVQWPSLVGVAALITVLINLGKSAGWVKDGMAPQLSAGLNLLGMVALIIFKVFKPDLTIQIIDGQANLIAQVLLIISGFALQIITSYLTHKSIAGVPGVGKSFSLEQSKSTPF